MCEKLGDDGDFHQFQWKNRHEKVLARIEQAAIECDVVCLQEVRDYNVGPILFRLEAGGLTTTQVAYGKRMSQAGVPDILVIAVRHPAVQKMDGIALAAGDPVLVANAGPYAVVTCHFPLPADERIELARRIGTTVGAIASTTGKKVIVTGDTNAFPDDQGYEQLSTLMAIVLYDASQFLVDEGQSGVKLVRETFDRYPYDKGGLDGQVEYDRNKLGYVFARGFEVASAHCPASERTLDGGSYGRFHESDHFPVVCTFSLNNSK